MLTIQSKLGTIHYLSLIGESVKMELPHATQANPNLQPLHNYLHMSPSGLIHPDHLKENSLVNYTRPHWLLSCNNPGLLMNHRQDMCLLSSPMHNIVRPELPHLNYMLN